MAEGNARETLISFRSGHYKKIKGEWKGDSVWCHFRKDSGGEVHVNKEEVEYVETFVPKIDFGPQTLMGPEGPSMEKARR